ncbi:MAG: 16S rRNA (cytosine(1402)-N(4))-methyltransferase RsmH [Firmicutes bacterium]|nr:16S rRNA (cytosine(1402)-N(4))-methyltransferase RsmH [Bacillota bacterium]
MTSSGFFHIPVMLNEAIEALCIKENGIYVDGTLGGGGHAIKIVEKGARLVGIDRDESAIKAAKDRLFGRFELINDNYNNIKIILKTLIINKIDGALLDLGVSSHQVDTPLRGFSYRFDAPLDMRMDSKSSLTAWHIVNQFEIAEIEKIFFSYGEEQYSKAIAKKIVEMRSIGPIETTFELVDIIKNAIPAKAHRNKHPAKKVFQALRIAVNDELSQLSATLEDFCEALNIGGRIAVITFHSLEDRIVKNTFAALARGCDCPSDFPVCVCGKKQTLKLITKKPITPSKSELLENPRSASAKLRVAEKI